MTSSRRDEIDAALDHLRGLRARIEAGEATWLDYAEMFTDDAVYIDPAWGRIEGIDKIREFLVESMTGLEDWNFPIEFIAVDGDDVAVKWLQILPSGARQSGWSRLVYSGDGKFGYQEDLLNMTHVIEDLTASGWRPGPGFSSPPGNPVRDFTIPERTPRDGG